jgi:hypothetical protein
MEAGEAQRRSDPTIVLRRGFEDHTDVSKMLLAWPKAVWRTIVSSSFFEPKENVLSVEQVRLTPTILTDATSLNNFDKLADPEFTRPMEPWCVMDAGFTIQYNILQSIILHDQIVVDSILIDSDSEVRNALELCPDVIRGVYLPFYVRQRIGQRLDRFVTSDLALQTGLDKKEFQEFRFADGSEQAKYDKAATQERRLVPLDYTSDPYIARFESGFPADVPSVLVRSSSSVGRAHFYAELSRELQIPLVPDPHKSRYLERVIKLNGAGALNDVPSRVVTEFDVEVTKKLEEDSAGIVSHDLTIPAVAEYVLRFAQKYKISLLTAALEIRGTSNAINFRSWCGRLASALAQGRAGTREQQELLRELHEVTKHWSKDINEMVEYKTRKMSFDKIPVVGAVLKAASMSTWTVRDPILKPSKPVTYLLFLNDLLRPPTRFAEN